MNPSPFERINRERGSPKPNSRQRVRSWLERCRFGTVFFIDSSPFKGEACSRRQKPMCPPPSGIFPRCDDRRDASQLKGGCFFGCCARFALQGYASRIFCTVKTPPNPTHDVRSLLVHTDPNPLDSFIPWMAKCLRMLAVFTFPVGWRLGHDKKSHFYAP